MKRETNRYTMVYSQTNGVGSDRGTEIWLDKETGISYLFCYEGYEEHFTPLLDEKGRTILKQLRKDIKGKFPWDTKRVS